MFFSKIKVTLALERDKMDMGMWNLHSKYCYTDSLTWDGSLQCDCDLTGESPETGISLFVEMEDIVIFDFLWDYESMALCKRADVKEGIIILALGYLVGRYFPIGYFSENCGHIIF